MTLTKKEKTLLIILAVLVYFFVFAKFVLMSSIPKIKEVKSRIEIAQTQLDSLERDYKNINVYKSQIKENEVINERLGEYLMDSAGVSDSIEFVEKLALLMGSNLKSISLGNSMELVENNITYYAFPINFNTVLDEEGLNGLIEFCEGGSRKVSINLLNISPTNEENIEEYGVVKSNKQQLFNVNIGLVFYAMDKDSANNLAKFTKAAFERFIKDNNIPVFIEDLKETAINTLPSDDQIASTAINQNNISSNVITLANADFKIFHRGYLYGGYNFETYTQFNRSDRIRSSISVPVNVSLFLGKTQYTIECVDGDGHINILTGDLPEKDYTLYIQSNINTNVRENENLWVNLRIRNDSGRKIITCIEQTGNRVKIMDRDGNEINGKNNKENVYL